MPVDVDIDDVEVEVVGLDDVLIVPLVPGPCPGPAVAPPVVASPPLPAASSPHAAEPTTTNAKSPLSVVDESICTSKQNPSQRSSCR
jgi:hypothetical protein